MGLKHFPIKFYLKTVLSVSILLMMTKIYQKGGRNSKPEEGSTDLEEEEN